MGSMQRSCAVPMVDSTSRTSSAQQGSQRRGTPGAAAPTVTPDFAIDSIALANGALTYRDEKTNASYAVSEMNLKTGRIANNQPSTIDLSGKVQGTAPKIDLAMQGKGGFSFDLDRKRVSLKDIALEAKGEAAGLNLAAKVRGSADADMKTPVIEAATLSVAATGNRDKDAFEIDLALPQLRLTKESVGGEQLAVKAALRQADGNVTSANLTLPKLEGGATTFESQTRCSMSTPSAQGRR